jgi:predicted ATPase
MPAVAAICERVDRLPLAIELAAMHIKVLSLPELLERLTNRLAFLRSGARDLPKRQQTMEEAITWSYELLPVEQLPMPCRMRARNSKRFIG